MFKKMSVLVVITVFALSASNAYANEQYTEGELIVKYNEDAVNLDTLWGRFVADRIEDRASVEAKKSYAKAILLL